MAVESYPVRESIALECNLYFHRECSLRQVDCFWGISIYGRAGRNRDELAFHHHCGGWSAFDARPGSGLVVPRLSLERFASSDRRAGKTCAHSYLTNRRPIACRSSAPESGSRDFSPCCQ